MTGSAKRARKPLLFAAGAALLTAFVGGSMTKIDDWYRGLGKSALNPPDWVFGPAWAIIYALAVLAGTAGWRAMQTSAGRAWLLSLFFVNALLNVGWLTFDQMTWNPPESFSQDGKFRPHNCQQF